jgi:hypothetical protein
VGEGKARARPADGLAGQGLQAAFPRRVDVGDKAFARPKGTLDGAIGARRKGAARAKPATEARNRRSAGVSQGAARLRAWSNESLPGAGRGERLVALGALGIRVPSGQNMAV